MFCGLVLLGWGCTETASRDLSEQPADNMVATTSTAVQDSNVVLDAELPRATKLSVARSFTLDEIETEGGGLKNWFRDLARANVAGVKTLVRVPVNHVQGFGCTVPLNYCASTITGGCYGPYLGLKGDIARISSAPGTLWEVEGYVVAANRLPEAKDDGTPSTCADGELAYDFEVTRVIQKIEGGHGDDFMFYEYK